VLCFLDCSALWKAFFANMSIAGVHDAPGKTASMGAYGVHENVVLTENEERDLKRGLGQRHIQMIALAGNFC
jgi:amino acid transporter